MYCINCTFVFNRDPGSFECISIWIRTTGIFEEYLLWLMVASLPEASHPLDCESRDFLNNTQNHKKAHSFDRFCKFFVHDFLFPGGYKVPASTVVALIWQFPKPLNFMTANIANNLCNRHWAKNLGRWTWTVSRVWATSRVHIHGNAGRVAWLMGSKGLEKNREAETRRSWVDN